MSADDRHQEEAGRVWPYRLALGLIVAAGAALAARWSLSIDEWRVMTDELAYVKVAQSMADTGSPAPIVRGVSTGAYGVLYPGVLAPLVGLFDLGTAFRIAHGMGAALMASAAIPAYLLTVFVSRSRAAGLAAAAPVAAVPWVLLSLNLMTEVLAYPLFVWASYAVVAAVADPSRKRDCLALLSLVVLLVARTQFILLFGLLPLAILVHELALHLAGWSPRAWVGQVGQAVRRAVTGHVVLVAVALVGGLIWLVSSASLPLGGYSSAIDTSDLFPPGFGVSAFEHLNQILFGIAFLPLALALGFVAESIRGRSGPQALAFAVWLVLVTPLLVAVATNFDLRIAGGVQQRYVFYIAPLLLVGAACFVRTARRPVLVTAGAMVVTALVATRSAYQPYADGSIFASPSRPAWVVLDGRVDQVAGFVGLGGIGNGLVLALGTAAVAAVMAWLLHDERRSLALGLLGVGVTTWCVVLTLYSAPKVRAEHESLAITGLGVKQPIGERDWIDSAVPEDATIALLPSPVNARDGKVIPLGTVSSQAVWWEAEFWNRSVKRSYLYRDSADYTPFGADRIRLDRRTGRLRATGGEAPYLAAAASDIRLAPVGRIVARGADLDIYRPRRPYQAAWATRGLTDDGEFRGPARFEVFGHHSSGARRYDLSVQLAGQTRGAGLRLRAPESRDQVRVFGRRVVRQRLCVPAGLARGITLAPAETQKVRVVGVRVRMGPPC